MEILQNIGSILLFYGIQVWFVLGFFCAYMAFTEVQDEYRGTERPDELVFHSLWRPFRAFVLAPFYIKKRMGEAITTVGKTFLPPRH